MRKSYNYKIILNILFSKSVKKQLGSGFRFLAGSGYNEINPKHCAKLLPKQHSRPDARVIKNRKKLVDTLIPGFHGSAIR